MLQVIPVRLAERISDGDDLAAMILSASENAAWPDGSRGLNAGDILVITSKIVSKAEGRIVRADSRDDAIDAETVRVVATKHSPRGATRIVETRHGLVMAAAGVDASNVDEGTVALLPIDPDASARALREALVRSSGVDIAVVITDTMGRPWRMGVSDVAIGAAGITVLDDYTGRHDAYGRTLEMTVVAIADEVAAAADLVKGKVDQSPVAIVRGLAQYVSTAHGPGARAIIRPLDEDLFTMGTAEALAAGRREGRSEATMGGVFLRRTVRTFTDEPVDPAVVEAAITAAVSAPAPHHSAPWRFAVLDQGPARSRVLDAMEHAWIDDLHASGFDDAAIARRTARGAILRDAPLMVIPFVDLGAGAHEYPDARRTSAERDMFMVSGGAAVENFMIALAAQGAASAWIGSTLFCADVVREVLSLSATCMPLGALAVGMPASKPAPRASRDPRDYLL